MSSVPNASNTDHPSSKSEMDEEMGGSEAGGKNIDEPFVIKDMDSGSSGNSDHMTHHAGSDFANGDNTNNAANNHIEDQIKKLEQELGIGVAADDDGTTPAPAESTVVSKFAEATIVGSSKNDDNNLGHDGNDPGDNNGMLAHMEIIEENISAIKRMEKRIRELERANPTEVDQDRKYPRDSYSFIALNGPTKVGWPIKDNWPIQKMIFFTFGFVVFVIQCIFNLLLMVSVMNMKRGTSEENDNPDIEEAGGFMLIMATFIPTNTTNIVKVTQVLSLLIYAGFPEDSVQDLVKAFRYFPKSTQRKIKGEPIRCIKLSCILRGIQGILAICAALVLVLTSRTVIDIILNFTALNSISGIDDTAFSLAEAGVFGPHFKRQTDFIKGKDLPLRVQRKTKHVIYWKVMGSILVFFVAVVVFVMASQESMNIWITKTFRVQFQEKEFKDFSGCYQIRGTSNLFNRRNYRSLDEFESGSTTSFGYCREERYWVFWENQGEDENIVDACKVTDQISHSLKTNDHDISTSFDTQWFFPISKTPFKVFFFDSFQEEELFCDLSLEDGVCDEAFNDRSYSYDQGDCCAATCNQPQCGKNGLTDAFEVANQTGDGYAMCENPKMHPVIIRIDDIAGSREPKFTEAADERWFRDAYINETEWRNYQPVNPLFTLDCNDRQVLSVYITPWMQNNSQTVMIEDGASCKVSVKNRTGVGGKVYDGVNEEEPIYYMNFTLIHIDYMNSEENAIEIFTQSSRAMGEIDFQRIPICYFKKLENHVDIETMYTASNSSNEAIRWLMKDSTGNSACEASNFIERYALANMLISMGGTIPLLSEANQCTWEYVACFRSKATQLYLRDQDLQGSLPSEIGLLTELSFLDIAVNNISSLTSELGLLSNLEKFYFAFNMISSLPSEIAQLTNLQDLSFSDNSVTMLPAELGLMDNLNGLFFNNNDVSIIPTNIGLMANLTEVFMANNNLTFIPTEIGALKKLRKLQVDDNSLTSLITEVGSLDSLISLAISRNKIQGALPSEIGMLKKLQRFHYNDNQVSSIPTEIGLLTKLRNFQFVYNEVLSIPTEIGLLAETMNDMRFWNNNLTSLPTELFGLSNLQMLDYSRNDVPIMASEIGKLTSLTTLQSIDNKISSLPSEVGALTNLKEFALYTNNIQSIPSEIGLMTNLNTLDFDDNFISSIPSEIGLNSNLTQLFLAENIISSIPSEMWLLTSLTRLYLYGNTISSIPSEIGSLKSLTRLYLHGNNISSIPSEIGSLKSLTRLYLNGNSISSIPSEIGLLTSLDRLRLNDNKISSIPSEMGLLTNLPSLDLSGNQFTSSDIPDEVKELCSAYAIDCNFDFNLPSRRE